MTVLSVSDGELRRLEVVQDLDQRRLMPAATGKAVGLRTEAARQSSASAATMITFSSLFEIN